jgi:hypothetical protein
MAFRPIELERPARAKTYGDCSASINRDTKSGRKVLRIRVAGQSRRTMGVAKVPQTWVRPFLDEEKRQLLLAVEEGNPDNNFAVRPLKAKGKPSSEAAGPSHAAEWPLVGVLEEAFGDFGRPVTLKVVEAARGRLVVELPEKKRATAKRV